MATASEGLWIQSAAAVGDILADARQFDGVIRTEGREARILVGFSNGASVGSTLMLTRTGATLNGSMAASNLIVGGSNVLTELASLRGAVDSVRAGNLDNGAVRSSAIADSNVPAQKISGVLPTAVGGTGTGAPGTFVGGRLAFGAADGGAERLLTSAALRFDPTTQAVTLGADGAARCSMTVDANGELVLTALSADGTPGASLSLRDVRVLLQNIGVVPA